MVGEQCHTLKLQIPSQNHSMALGYDAMAGLPLGKDLGAIHPMLSQNLLDINRQHSDPELSQASKGLMIVKARLQKANLFSLLPSESLLTGSQDNILSQQG